MGKRLKQILNDKHIKIVDFAKQAGFTNQIAHYYLRKKDIKRATLERFCKVIGITVQDFMQWEGSVQPDGVLHYGQRFRQLVNERGINKTRIADLLGITRREAATLSDKVIFSESEMETVLKGLNISIEHFLNPDVLDDAPQPPRDQQLRERYYRLLEDHTSLLKELASYKEEVRQLRETVDRLENAPRAGKR